MTLFMGWAAMMDAFIVPLAPTLRKNAVNKRWRQIKGNIWGRREGEEVLNIGDQTGRKVFTVASQKIGMI
jgi:hypothetical protein